ncbi:AAA family ATPase [Desulfofundulus sp.]|uniref:AAA family ATPase n=1 Tax=Desulfofundulus sp. TaxID=2282750 RepID=UPI003C7146DB
MRPIELRLAGLHSYRQEEVVDFNALCERGIFGIFGPTGSGKSTILDAVTLALFGEVKRASRGREGIINQQSEQARVAFTFEVGRGEGRCRYRVERVLRKSGDFGAHTRECRLVRIDPDGERVLADGADQVRTGVQELLGLTADDFTRAVVLPQGRFAEFLALRPADRNQMLERIFELDRFGEQLKRRVGDAGARVQADLDRVEAEQRGLGDCSPRALEEARQALEKNRAARREAERDLQAIRRRLEEVREILQAQGQRASLQHRLQELQAAEGQVRWAEERLERAARAETLRGLLEEYGRLEEDLERRRARLRSLQEEMDRREEAARAAEEEAGRIRRHWEERGPALLKRQARLEQAREQEKELDIWLEQQAGDQKQLEQLELSGQKMVKQQEELASRLDLGERRLSELRKLCAQFQVALEEVEQARCALDLYRELTRLGQEVKKMEGEREEAARQLAVLQQQETELAREVQVIECELKRHGEDLEHLQGNPPVPEGYLEQRAGEIQGLRHRIEALQELAARYHKLQGEHRQVGEQLALLERQRDVWRQKAVILQQALEEADKALDRARQQLEEARRRNMAADLARMLEAGRACPVCGSLHHPSPASPAGAELTPHEEAVEAAEEEQARRRDEWQECQKKIVQLETEIAALERRERQLAEEKEQLGAEGGRLRGELPAEWQGVPVQDLPARLQRAEQAYQEQQRAWRDWQQQLKEALDRKEELRRRLDELRPALARLQSDRAGLGRQIEALCRHLGEKGAERQAVGEKLGLLLEVLGLADPEQVPGYWDALREKQQKHRDCQDEMAELEAELKDLAGRIQKLKDDLRDLVVQKGALKATLAGREEQIRRLRAELHGLTGGLRVQEALGQVREELSLLQGALARAEEESRRAAETCQRARLELKGEEQTCAALQERREDLCRRLERSARENHFAGFAEARDALLDPQEREELAGRVKEYRQEEQVLLKGLQEVEARLKGVSVDEGEWLRLQEELRAAEEALGLAQQQEGAAGALLQKLQENRERWAVLEGERQHLARRAALLRELEGLLRGRALVEFLSRRRLENLVALATERLGRLTGYRYALELDGQGGFILRDEGNGGLKRPVSTLSGGETFLVSLALALALSDQIQRRGRAPLEFFFLDEGFGSLDEQCLEAVMDTLERLPLERVAIGLISHLPQLKSRLPRRLVVEPARPGGPGSRVRLELA